MHEYDSSKKYGICHHFIPEFMSMDVWTPPPTPSAPGPKSTNQWRVNDVLQSLLQTWSHFRESIDNSIHNC